MANSTHRQSRHCCLCILVLAFLFGSGVWLKLILSDVLSFDLSYDLLYEREYMPETTSHWRVARGLNISVDLDSCTVKRPPVTTRRSLDEEGLNETVGVSLSADEYEALVAKEAATLADVDALEAAVDSPYPPPPPGAPPPAITTPFPPPSPAPDKNPCAIGQVEIQVNATLQRIEKPVGPLYFVVYYSQTWSSFYQASKVDLTESLFNYVACENTNTSYDPECIDGQKISPVSVSACVGNPGFTYLVGCVLEGYNPGHLGSEVQPPFSSCVAIDGLCGASCGSAVWEPSFYDPMSEGFHQNSAKHCVAMDDSPMPTLPLNGGDKKLKGDAAIRKWRHHPAARTSPEVNTVGRVRLDDIEAWDLDNVGLGFPSYLFGCMYVLGVLSLFLMYVPSIGQREGVAPTWNRLKQTIISAKIRMLADDYKTMRRRPSSRHNRQVPTEHVTAGFARNNGHSAPNTAPIEAAQPWPTASMLANGGNGATVGAVSANAQPLLTDPGLSDARMWINKQGERGMIPCLASISATESPNIVLRNAIGKIAVSAAAPEPAPRAFTGAAP